MCARCSSCTFAPPGTGQRTHCNQRLVDQDSHTRARCLRQRRHLLVRLQRLAQVTISWTLDLLSSQRRRRRRRLQVWTFWTCELHCCLRDLRASARNARSAQRLRVEGNAVAAPGKQSFANWNCLRQSPGLRPTATPNLFGMLNLLDPCI